MNINLRVHEVFEALDAGRRVELIRGAFPKESFEVCLSKLGGLVFKDDGHDLVNFPGDFYRVIEEKSAAKYVEIPIHHGQYQRGCTTYSEVDKCPGFAGWLWVNFVLADTNIVYFNAKTGEERTVITRQMIDSGEWTVERATAVIVEDLNV